MFIAVILPHIALRTERDVLGLRCYKHPAPLEQKTAEPVFFQTIGGGAASNTT
jgi:hypothetical protein